MQEVKSPKKPFLYYCLIVATIMVLLNSLVFPNVLEHSVKEVDYNTFMKMTENKEIGKVNIDSGEIIFTDKSEEKMYKTGVMDDPGLVDRLYDSGADFSSKITEEMSEAERATQKFTSNPATGLSFPMWRERMKQKSC